MAGFGGFLCGLGCGLLVGPTWMLREYVGMIKDDVGCSGAVLRGLGMVWECKGRSEIRKDVVE